jgi:hypothetical protein
MARRRSGRFAYLAQPVGIRAVAPAHHQYGVDFRRKLQSGLVANYALFMLLFGIGIFYVIFYFSRLGDR